MKKAKILWIEDDAQFAAVAIRRIKSVALKSGIDLEFSVAGTWYEGTTIATESDLVILDLELPDSRAEQTTARIAGVFQTWPPIVVATGSQAPVDMMCMYNGADDWMPKEIASVDPSQFLARMIHSLVRRTKRHATS